MAQMIIKSLLVNTVLCATLILAAQAQEPGTPDNLPSDVQNKLKMPLIPSNHIVKDIFLVPSTDPNKSSSEAPLSSIITKAKLSIIGRDVITNGLHGIMISVANDTDRPLIFDGDAAIATVSGAKYTAAPIAGLEPPKSPPDDPKGKLKSDLWATASSAVTVGALQTVLDQKRFDGPILGRYEQDEDRRRNEASRFGKRVVWPGDSSQGVVYFNGVTTLQDAALSVPVHVLYNNDEQAVLRTDGPAATSLPRIPAP
jgi:hypothetical protein